MRVRQSGSLILVTPYLASANNGNWRTAARWARMLAPRFRVILQAADAPLARDDAVAMVALHARRSRAAIERWKQRHPDRALVVALTGTDLYGDVPAGDADAIASLADADRLVVLQDDALRHVPAAWRAKASVVLQSARPLAPWPHKAKTRLNAILVGHLRDVKDPRTALEAWRRLPAGVRATLTIVGGALDAALGDEVRRAAAADPRVRWLGARPHAWTRQAIRRAHVLVVASRMEGGANVVAEALAAHTPVIGTRMSGNLGLLGDGYPGYFAVGDADGLAHAIARAAGDRAWLASLRRAGERRARLMTPQAEARSLAAAVAEAIAAKGRGARMTVRRTPAKATP